LDIKQDSRLRGNDGISYFSGCLFYVYSKQPEITQKTKNTVIPINKDNSVFNHFRLPFSLPSLPLWQCPLR